MRDELDELLSDFARGQLAGQIGKTAPAFSQARACLSRRRRNVAAGLVTMLAVVAAVVHFHEPAGAVSTARQSQAAGGSEMVSEQVWYRDVPGPLVVLQDHTLAQIICRQVFQVQTSGVDQNNTTQTQAQPAELTLLVRRPVY